MPDSPKTALILAGHGSHISPNTAGIVWQYVDALRAAGVADEITAAFWKEPPAFHTVFRTLLAPDITIVPMFTANGYFTETVIPAEMGLAGATTLRDGRTLRYTRPIGEHAIIGQIVEQRARDALRDYGLTPAQTCLAIIGHSTRRNPRSRAATEAQAERLRSLDIAAEVHAIYLDDDPEIPTIYTTTQQPFIVAIPYFLAAGSHTTMDVPDELGIGAGQTSGVVEGHQVYYTPPLGIGTELLPAILDLAREAGMVLHEPRENGSAWECFPQAGREAWLARFAEHKRSFPVGGFWLNAKRAWVAKRTSAPTHALHTPAEVRDHARTMPFHPLAAEIAPDWYMPITQPEQLHAIMETIHPGGVAEWALLQQGAYEPNTLEQVLARQTGMYKRLATLDDATIDHITRTTCLAECPRAPMWSALNKGSALPCYEPCNVWLSAALAHLDAKNAATYAD